MQKSLKELNVLYVEDDPDLLETNELLFGRIFKSITGFADAGVALEAFLQAPEKFQLVICDLRMPGMDGVEFYRHLRQANSAIPFALMSGELDLTEFIAALPQKDSIITLPKPCKMPDLIQKISEKI